MSTKNKTLELVADNAGGKLFSERRRLPRLNLSTEQFRHTESGKIYSITDISETGIALRVLDPAELRNFTIASEFEGTLNLHREKFKVRAKVRHLGHEHVGCELIELDSKTRAALAKFLDPAALGSELKPIPASESSGTLWYHGPSGTDLILRRGADGQYRKMSLFVLGSYIQWEDESGLSTGRTESSEMPEEVRGIVRFETLLLQQDTKPDVAKLRIAKTLILSSNLPQDLKKWCARQIEVHS